MSSTDALLVIDVQRALLDELSPLRRDELLATLVPFLDRARAAGIPIVYIRNDGSPDELIPGTPEWEIGDEVAPHPGDTIVEKRHNDAFVETNLTDVLTTLGTDHLIVSGMQTDYCVNATLRGAARHGYRTTLVADAHATPTANEAEVRAAMHDASRAGGTRIANAAEIFR